MKQFYSIRSRCGLSSFYMIAFKKWEWKMYDASGDWQRPIFVIERIRRGRYHITDPVDGFPFGISTSPHSAMRLAESIIIESQ
jgi:hypothetical protein